MRGRHHCCTQELQARDKLRTLGARARNHQKTSRRSSFVRLALTYYDTLPPLHPSQTTVLEIVTKRIFRSLHVKMEWTACPSGLTRAYRAAYQYTLSEWTISSCPSHTPKNKPNQGQESIDITGNNLRGLAKDHHKGELKISGAPDRRPSDGTPSYTPQKPTTPTSRPELLRKRPDRTVGNSPLHTSKGTQEESPKREHLLPVMNLGISRSYNSPQSGPAPPSSKNNRERYKALPARCIHSDGDKNRPFFDGWHTKPMPS